MNQLTATLIITRGLLARFARIREQEDGATVLEWALIAAVVVVAATVIATVILKIVHEKANRISTCSQEGANCG